MQDASLQLKKHPVVKSGVKATGVAFWEEYFDSWENSLTPGEEGQRRGGCARTDKLQKLRSYSSESSSTQTFR